MKNTIIEELQRLEQKHEVTILYACESGSRAWGFASADSDYDVRFIYARKPEQYVSILTPKDVIELPVNELLDINGWDIKKALQLFLKSNAPLYEWLQSPVIYKEESRFAAELRHMMNEYFSCRAGCHHYFSMARNSFEHDLQGEMVKLKKYFYALRPALACLWILEKRTVPPMEFGQLRVLVNDTAWHQTVDELLRQKQLANEKDMIAPLPLLQKWLQETLLRCHEEMIPYPL